MSFRGTKLPLLLIVALPVLALIIFMPRPRPLSPIASAPTAPVAPSSTVTPPPPSATSTAIPTDTPVPTATPIPIPTLIPTPLPPPSLTSAADAAYVPILMYHYIRTVDEGEDPLGYRLSITPEVFAQQMEWLHTNDYTPIRMDMLSACLRGQTTCPENPVALTFDDGYADAATAALPILKQYGFVATFYVVINFIGQPGYMTWEQIELMRDSGMEIGSHTISHADLTVLSLEEAQAQVVDSRQILEERLGIPILSFCYPIGSYNPEVAELVRDAGYTSAVTVIPGSSMELMYELPRRRIVGGESLEGFAWYLLPPGN